MRLKEAISLARCKLANATEIPQKEALILLSFLLKKEPAWILAHDDERLQEEERFWQLVARREKFEPIEYITGSACFYGMDFAVQSGVLIPRPETELLVDELLEGIKSIENPHIVDVGCGSGAIACTIAKHRPDAVIMAVDINDKALQIAKQNANRLDVSQQITFLNSDLLEQVPLSFNIVVSNPPYIASSYDLPPSVKFEPSNALFAGAEGMDIFYRLIKQTQERNSIFLACEMGYDQKDKIESLLAELKLPKAHFYRDYSGFDRGFTLQF